MSSRRLLRGTALATALLVAGCGDLLKKKDAGAVTVAVEPVDAAVLPPPLPAPALVDASNSSLPIPSADVVAPTGGMCPGNFVLVPKTGRCHRPCPLGASSQACQNQPFFCVRCGDDKVCADSKDQCR